MDSFWIIFLFGFLAVFDGCHSIYEIKAKRTLDAQTHWRPISPIGVQASPAQRFFSLPNLDTGKYRLGQLNNNNNQYMFRHVKPPSPPIQQYRSPFSFYQKANKAFLGVQKPSQKFLASSTSHAVFGKHELPSLMNPHYYNDFHSSANIAPAFKPFPVLKSPSQQNIGLHNPILYRDIALPHPLSTTYPALIQHQIYNTPTTPKIAYENNKTPLRFATDALSSYSFFGPAAHLVRNQHWPSQGIGNLPEATFKASSTALPSVIPSTGFRLNLLPSSSSTSTTENSYNWDTTRNPINFEQEIDTRNAGKISQNVNWSHTPDPLTQDEYSKILVPPPPFLNRENFRNISEPDRGHQNISPFGDPKDVIISNQNFISTSTSTSRTPNEHFTIKSESGFPANNRDVFSHLNIALTTEKPNTFNFNHVNQIINELEKVKAKNSLTNNKPNIESDFESNFDGGFAPVQGNYNTAHNFFTINDAITMPPFMKSTVHTEIIHKPVFTEQTHATPSVSIPVNINIPVETTTKVQLELTSSEPVQSNIKMRRRYPVTRIQSTNSEKQTQPVRTLNDIPIGKQRNITSTLPPSRTIKRPKVNQRKRTRTKTTTEATVRTSTSTRDSNIHKEENNVPIEGTISTFTGLSNRLPSRILKDSVGADNTNLPTITQTTPTLMNKPRNTFAPSPPEENFGDAPSSEQSISLTAPSTTPLSTQIYSSLNTFNLETSTLDGKNAEESLTKEPVLEAALSTVNLERMKTIRLKQRTRTTTSRTTTPRASPPQLPEKEENPQDLTTSSTEGPKIVKLRPVTTFELKRPRFSVKDYKTRLRTQLRSTTTSTTAQYPLTTPSSERSVSKIPTRKRLLATFKTKLPLNESSEKPVEPKPKEILNSSLETPPQRKRNDQNSESYRNAVRMRTSTTSTESSSSGVPKIRKQLSRPRYSTLKERIQTYKSRKPKPEELEPQTSDDLVNITVEVKHDPTTEMSKLESAIMKIAKQDSFHRGGFPALPSQEMLPEENTSGDSSNNSEYVAQLTSGSSKKFNKMKIGGSRGIPEYFTIATDDPILPIEAFFPNVKKE